MPSRSRKSSNEDDAAAAYGLSDEELARALQRQYEHDMRTLSQRQQNRTSSSTAGSSSRAARHSNSTGGGGGGLSRSHHSRTSHESGSSNSRQSRTAERSGTRERSRSRSRHRNQQQQQSADTTNHQNRHASTATAASTATMTDEELARHLDAEERRRFERRQQKHQQRMVQEQQRQQQSGASNSTSTERPPPVAPSFQERGRSSGSTSTHSTTAGERQRRRNASRSKSRERNALAPRNPPTHQDPWSSNNNHNSQKDPPTMQHPTQDPWGATPRAGTVAATPTAAAAASGGLRPAPAAPPPNLYAAPSAPPNLYQAPTPSRTGGRSTERQVAPPQEERTGRSQERRRARSKSRSGTPPERRPRSRSRHRQQQEQQSAGSSLKDDEALARRLAAEEEARHGVSPFAASTALTVSSSRASSLTPDMLDDEEVAMKVQQEMRDEALAQSMQTMEHNRANQVRGRAIVVQDVRRNRFRRTCTCLTVLFLLGGGVAGLVYYFFILGNDLPEWIPTPEDFAEEDPFNAKTPADANAWDNNGNGVNLEVLNALDEYWHAYFTTAVSDWDNGYPDTLSLVTGERPPEPRCQPVSGKVKVCNGNYGRTLWKGINEVLIDRSGNIFASSARMNEYYLGAPGDPDQMQYTMCHEIGHAWGLPHTDESFTNKDLGNCMDYTNSPENNKTPDDSNYQFLYALYGLVPGAVPYTPPTSAPTFAPTPALLNEGGTQSASSAFDGGDQLPSTGGAGTGGLFEDTAGNDLPAKKEKGGRRARSKKAKGRETVPNRNRKTTDEAIPEWMSTSLDDARLQFQDRLWQGEEHGHDDMDRRGERNGWRMLHKSLHGEGHEYSLGDGYTLQIHALLAPESN